MKIIVVGYGEMLQALISGILSTKHQIVGVFRHENVIYSKLKNIFLNKFKPTYDCLFVQNHNLYDIKAGSVNSKEFRDEVERLGADLIIVGSWSEKFSMQTINLPKIGCINVHPSLLPKYRGPNPYIQTILHNEKESGITFHLMDVNYDTGAILHQAKTDISADETGATLKLKCCNLARSEVPFVLDNISDLTKNQISQNEKAATYQHQLKLAESILYFEKESAEEIDRRIRALTPWLKCVIPYNNMFFEFNKYKICSRPSAKKPAQIIKIKEDSFYIVCADNKVIEFSGLKLKMFNSKTITDYYIKNFVKINNKAV